MNTKPSTPRPRRAAVAAALAVAGLGAGLAAAAPAGAWALTDIDVVECRRCGLSAVDLNIAINPALDKSIVVKTAAVHH